MSRLYVSMEVIDINCGTANSDILHVALLHDVLEDTDTSREEVLLLTNERAASAVVALTKTEGVSKEEYYSNIVKAGELAIRVKLADRIANLSFPPPEFWSNEKVESYKKDSIMLSEMLRGHSMLLDVKIRKKIKDWGINERVN